MKPLLKSRHRWEDDIKIDLKEVGWETINFSTVAQEPAQANVDTAIGFWVP
jgi:hypothetical protein